MTIIDDLKRFKENNEVTPEDFAQYLATKLRLNPGLFEMKDNSEEKAAPKQRKPRKQKAEEKEDSKSLFESPKA